MSRAEIVSKYLHLGLELLKEKDEIRRFEIEVERENLKMYYYILFKEV